MKSNRIVRFYYFTFLLSSTMLTSILMNLSSRSYQNPSGISNEQECISELSQNDDLILPLNFYETLSMYRELSPFFSNYLKLTQIKGQPGGHLRFFPLTPVALCKNVTSVGGSELDDESKLICGINKLVEGCIIYSFGGNNQWSFELDLLIKTPCTIHTFDCTGPKQRFEIPDSRIHFHHICIGAKHEEKPDDCLNSEKCGEVMTLREIINYLNHSNVDIIKLDVEGFEISILNSWKSEDTLPSQVLMELHYYSQFKENLDEEHARFGLHDGRGFEIAFAHEIWNFTNHLFKLGLIPVIRNDNIHCTHCTELTLMALNAKCSTHGE
jgi:Methyltransferase domain